MNAIVCLCHFCEAHGPCVLFGTGISNGADQPGAANRHGVVCSACTSIGPDAVITSTSPEGIIYVSRQRQSSSEIDNCLKQAAFRSLSCEVSPTREGGCFYFGDANRGHVMSYTFQVKDSSARGLKRWFSVIILMKDRMYLLNLMTYLLEHVQVLTKHLQDNAEINFENDQKLCSQRALRLQTGKMENSSPRSLVELTDNPNIYNYLHQSFTRILDIGRQTYSETLYASFNCGGQSEGRERYSRSVSDMKIRKLKETMGVDLFPKLLYCVLIGIQVIIKAEITKGIMIVNSLSKLIPDSSFEVAQKNNMLFKEKLVCCDLDFPVPPPCSSKCRIDIVDDLPILYWQGECPRKYPTLMKHIVNAIDEIRMNDSVLEQHIFTLTEEWMGIAATIKTVENSPEGPKNVAKLKQVLGVKPEDENVLNYWKQFLQNK